MNRLTRSTAAALLLCLAAGCKEAPPQTGAPPSEPSAAQASPAPAPQGDERLVLAFGDSLFAGYGLAPAEGYPERLEAALRAAGRPVRVHDAGVSGDTTAAGRQRLAFTLDSLPRKPDLVLLELGGNDLLRGLSPAETRANLAAMLGELQRREIPVVLFGMRAPPNLGADFVRAFDAAYPALAKEYGATLVPFFLEPVYDQPQLIQPDRVHPTAAGIDALVGHTQAVVSGALPVS